MTWRYSRLCRDYGATASCCEPEEGEAQLLLPGGKKDSSGSSHRLAGIACQESKTDAAASALEESLAATAPLQQFCGKQQRAACSTHISQPWSYAYADTPS